MVQLPMHPLFVPPEPGWVALPSHPTAEFPNEKLVFLHIE